MIGLAPRASVVSVLLLLISAGGISRGARGCCGWSLRDQTHAPKAKFCGPGRRFEERTRDKTARISRININPKQRRTRCTHASPTPSTRVGRRGAGDDAIPDRAADRVRDWRAE